MGQTPPARIPRPGGLSLFRKVPHGSVQQTGRRSVSLSGDGAMPPTRPTPVNTSLLSGLPEHLSESLFTKATPVKLAADETLFMAGDAGDGCYRVEDGLLKVIMMSRAGGERILAFLGSGAIVGELSIIDGLPRSASVVAVRNSELSFLSRAAFEDFARAHGEVYKSLVALLAARLRETDAVIAAGSFLPLRGRVAVTLLELAHEFGQDVGSGRIVIRQKIGQADLAAMAGIARENVSRILNDWKRRKLVSRLSGYYCLENKAQLQREAEL
jgi:CRP/FNR family transcriptional regulator, cyclic AMP receptor protein